MPARDGTGPMGAGARSGRGRGCCGGTGTAGPGGKGRFRRGRRGGGGGRGQGQLLAATGKPVEKGQTPAALRELSQRLERLEVGLLHGRHQQDE